MVLKKKLTSLDGLPADVAKEYKKQGSVYVLDTETDEDDEDEGEKPEPVSNAVNKKLRKQNEQLQAALTELQGKYKDVDPEQYSRLLNIVGGIEDEKELADFKAGKLTFAQLKQNAEKRAQDATRKVVEKAEKDAKTAAEDAAKWRQHYTRSEIGKAAREGAKVAKVTVVDEEDLLNYAIAAGATVDDEGKPVLLDKQGNPLTGSDGKPHTWASWVQSVMEVKSHYFAPGEGGGAKPGKGSGRPATATVQRNESGALVMNAEQRKAVIEGKATVAP